MSHASGFLFTIVVFAQMTAMANFDAPACQLAHSQSPLYQAMQKCENMKVAKTAEQTANALSGFKTTAYCAVDADPEGSVKKDLKDLCADPAAFVCSRHAANVMNSHCELFQDDNGMAAQTPGYAAYDCKAKAAVDAFLTHHHKECPAGPRASCDGILKASHAAQIAKILRDEAYTPERLRRVQAAYAQVRAREITIIQKSNVIPNSLKPMLIKR